MQADILDGGPDNRQATILSGEHINLIGALPHVADSRKVCALLFALVISSMPALAKTTKNSVVCCRRVLWLSCEQVIKGLAGLSWRWDNAKLLQHTKQIKVRPDFHDLAACDAQDIDARDRHGLASGRDAH